MIRNASKINEGIKCITKEKICCQIVCSALKNKYRYSLSLEIETQTKWIHLVGSFNQISKRMQSRSDHFMPSNLLKSQFEILENPTNAFEVNISLTPKEIVNKIKKELINKVNVIDSLEVARNKFPGTSNSLDALCRRFNIDLSRMSPTSIFVPSK